MWIKKDTIQKYVFIYIILNIAHGLHKYLRAIFSFTVTDGITSVATLSKRVRVYVFTTKVKKSRAQMLDFQITKHPKY